MRSKGDPVSKTYSETASIYRMALVEKDFPKAELSDDELGTIQGVLLRMVDSTSAGEPLPLSRTTI